MTSSIDPTRALTAGTAHRSRTRRLWHALPRHIFVVFSAHTQAPASPRYHPTPSQNDARTRRRRRAARRGRRAAELGAWRRQQPPRRSSRVLAARPLRRAVRCCGLVPRGGTEGCAAFLDELGTARGVDSITPVSAKRHDRIAHRAARGRAECARVLEGGARRGTRAAPRATRRRCSPRRPRCSPLRSAAFATTRSLDESAGDNWLRCFRSTARIHITARQRDLLTRRALRRRTARDGRPPPKN